MKNEFCIEELFRRFIRDSKSGLRRKPDGNKIKPQTVENYENVHKLLIEFELYNGKPLRLKLTNRLGSRELRVEMNYWKRFYNRFSQFLFTERKCCDNYVGHVFKIIRVFFNYLEKDRLLNVASFKKHFFVRKEDVEIVTLMPHQVRYLIYDKTFQKTLTRSLETTRKIFVFGCTTGLRCSDIFSIRFRDIETKGEVSYLVSRAIKTGTISRILLPDYLVKIIDLRRKGSTPSSKIFSPLSNAQFNKNIRKLAECAGWTQPVGRFRSRDGVIKEQLYRSSQYRFCDLLSSHTMRRSAITNMLMMGVSELVVRSISGHAPGSTSFYRYVNLAQSFMDTEVGRMHEKLSDNIASQFQV